MSYLFDKEIYIVGIRRGGMHAIQNWIVKKFNKEDYIYQNDTHFQLRDGGKGYNKLKILPKNNYNLYINVVEQESIYGVSCSHNCKKSKMNFQKKSFSKKMGVDNFSKSCLFILVLRDPFNNLASMFKKFKEHEKGHNKSALKVYTKMIEGFRKIWIEYAKEFLGETNYLPNKHMILYNKWFSSKKYRLKKSKELKIPKSDLGFLEVKNGHESSSFDSDKYDGRANQMKVLERWKEYKDNKKYREILDNKELLLLCKKIFKRSVPIDFDDKNNSS